MHPDVGGVELVDRLLHGLVAGVRVAEHPPGGIVEDGLDVGDVLLPGGDRVSLDVQGRELDSGTLEEAAGPLDQMLHDVESRPVRDRAGAGPVAARGGLDPLGEPGRVMGMPLGRTLGIGRHLSPFASRSSSLSKPSLTPTSMPPDSMPSRISKVCTTPSPPRRVRPSSIASKVSVSSATPSGSPS